MASGVIAKDEWRNVTKQCGTCNMCCRTDMFKIDDVKSKGNRCEHSTNAKGCKIYKKRPKDCKEWGCYWLKVDHYPKFMKPNRCGFVMAQTPETNEFCLYVDPDKPDAWKSQEFLIGLIQISAHIQIL